MPILIGGAGGDITLALHTREQKPILNFYCTEQSDDGEVNWVRDQPVLRPNVKHRPVGPSRAYNCHGLTFAARRTAINHPAEVVKIIKQDKYKLLKENEEVMGGDIAIYVKEGEITHSGIVVWVEAGTPWILSKWARYHEAIHKPSDCPYNDASVIYYRLER